jgi:UDP-N-acetylmuramoylalanine--D-glutamate ligase
MDFSGNKILIMGLGLLGGGIGSALFFAQKGAQVTVTDLKDKNTLHDAINILKDYDISFTLGKHDEKDFINADLIIKNPAVPSNSPYLSVARKNNIPIEMAESLFMKLSPTKNIIGVTGTRGKSTTSHMIYEVLKNLEKKVVLGGNIKNTSTLDLLNIVDSSYYVVLELSSWMLESFGWFKISPRYSIITNIYPDHLNRYSSMNEYIHDKKNIYLYQNSDDYLFLNRDNSYSKEFASETKARLIWFGKDDIQSFGPLTVPGEHNRANAAGAYAVATMFKLDEGKTKESLTSFKGLPYRLETVAVIHGVTFINDSASTTPIAGITALDSFEGKSIVLIAGGNTKNIPISQFIEKINKRVKYTILFEGTAYNEFKSIQNKSKPYPIGKFEDVLNEAYRIAIAGDVVLFSPGVTHLPTLNEFERGDLYKKEVERLQQEEN